MFRREKADQRMVTFAVEVCHKLLKTVEKFDKHICALFISVRC
jgi:hypothetical protein